MIQIRDKKLTLCDMSFAHTNTKILVLSELPEKPLKYMLKSWFMKSSITLQSYITFGKLCNFIIVHNFRRGVFRTASKPEKYSTFCPVFLGTENQLFRLLLKRGIFNIQEHCSSVIDDALNLGTYIRPLVQQN